MRSGAGLNAVQRAVLEALDELGHGPARNHTKSARVVMYVYETRGIPPQYAYDTLCTLASPWLVHIELVDMHGNIGSADPGDAPAGARYTETCMSTAGQLALAAERGEAPPLPVGLINGDW